MSTPRIMTSSPTIAMLHYYIYTDDSLAHDNDRYVNAQASYTKVSTS